MLWRVANTGLRILATCHTLQPSDYPIASVSDGSYTASERVIFEADVRAPELRTVGIGCGDDTLLRLDPDLYRRVETALISLGQDVTSLAQFKPWFADLRLRLARIQREGFDFKYSLDDYLRERAEADRKTIEFLEMPLDSLLCFDSQPLADQVEQLNFSLAHEGWAIQQIHRVVNGWRKSDQMELLSAQEEYMGLFPALYRCLLVRRNHNWLPRLEQLARETPYTLVCVGALHCVGKLGIPALLSAVGLKAHLEH